MNQLTLNLKEKILLGKKLETLSFRASTDLAEQIDKLANKKYSSRSDLILRWVIDGLTRELGEVYLLEVHADRKLSELLE